MANYAVYMRTIAGHVLRLRDFSSNYPHYLLKLYFHKESLTGFPEKTVFWINREGPSIGIGLCLDIQKPPD
jgi:hypothetical protein